MKKEEFVNIIQSIKSLNTELDEYKERNIKILDLYTIELKELKNSIINKKYKRSIKKGASMKHLKTDTDKILSEYTRLHPFISKLNKYIEEKFDNPIKKLCQEGYNEERDMIELIFYELLFSFDFEILKFYKQGPIIFNNVTKEYNHCIEIYNILYKFKNTMNYDIIIDYIKNDNKLNQDDILFEIYKSQILHFLQLSDLANAFKILQFISHFQQFQQDIHTLSAALAFYTNPKSSSFQMACQRCKNSDQLIEYLIDSIFKIYRYPRESLLQTCFVAGCICAKEIDNGIKNTVYREYEPTCLNDIKVKINLPCEFIRHPIFVCPIQQDEITYEQSAIRLECGHALSLHNFDSILNFHYKRDDLIACPICNYKVSDSKYQILKL